eukprot:365513-Chlamydomonas_euryale.AAC.2
MIYALSHSWSTGCVRDQLLLACTGCTDAARPFADNWTRGGRGFWTRSSNVTATWGSLQWRDRRLAAQLLQPPAKPSARLLRPEPSTCVNLSDLAPDALCSSNWVCPSPNLRLQKPCCELPIEMNFMFGCYIGTGSITSLYEIEPNTGGQNLEVAIDQNVVERASEIRVVSAQKQVTKNSAKQRPMDEETCAGFLVGTKSVQFVDRGCFEGGLGCTSSQICASCPRADWIVRISTPPPYAREGTWHVQCYRRVVRACCDNPRCRLRTPCPVQSRIVQSSLP